jgi:endonuclease YncB( thermonuclease family)
MSNLVRLLIITLLLGSFTVTPTIASLVSEEKTALTEATVVEVIDGDTIKVKIEDEEYDVRLIGIDAPEKWWEKVNGWEKNPEPCSEEATELLCNLVDGKKVYLEKDITDKDIYGRLLRYVYVDGVFVNKEIARQGYAFVYAYDRWEDNKHYEELERAADKAVENRRGIYNYPIDSFERLSDYDLTGYYIPEPYYMVGVMGFSWEEYEESEKYLQEMERKRERKELEEIERKYGELDLYLHW